MVISNHLAQETSPYLQQHAHNPVDWYPWGTEALDKAKQENKPILLSIGYSACHWCHVMAHESFADNDTASVMNQLFINIKVDREERPDLDKIYQTLHQLLTGQAGGWPLTVFLSPDQHIPFFTGTYFPKQPRYQLPAFKDLLQRVADFYQRHQQQIASQKQNVLAILHQLNMLDTTDKLNLDAWQLALQQLITDFDAIHGGFGAAPKFPHPTYLNLLIRDVYTANCQNLVNNKSWQMVKKTLNNMALGGIYDQIGGGFYRYAVDAQWEIPHFEKMLYDNAQLLAIYAQVYAITPSLLFSKVINQTATWIINDMQSPSGGYYAALDADSAGKEGYFYLWTLEQIQSLVNPQEYQKLLVHFNLQQPANFESLWHLHVLHSAAEENNESLFQVETLITSGCTKLHAARNKRVHPMCDEKILTAWNALMIKGMVLAGAQLEQTAWLDSAQRALDFIYNHLWKNGRLLATYKDGRAHLTAYLDDYAFLLDAILTFLQHRWYTPYILFAQKLADVLLTHFVDHQQGGFFFVADDHEALIYRPKTFADEVIPAGNGVACYALQRLGYLLGEQRYLVSVEKTLKAVLSTINKYPSAHAYLLLALREYLIPPQIIIIRGEDDVLHEWQAALKNDYTPARMIFSINHDEINMPVAIAEKKSTKEPIAYICQGEKCLPPIMQLKEVSDFLQNNIL